MKIKFILCSLFGHKLIPMTYVEEKVDDKCVQGFMEKYGCTRCGKVVMFRGKQRTHIRHGEITQ